MLGNIIGALNGYKTKIAAICTLVAVGAFVFKLIDPATYEALVVALGALGLWALRSAITTTVKPNKK